jgi:hypothetical protein
LAVTTGQTQPIRLTRRGRLVVMALACGLTLGALWTLAGHGEGARAASTPVHSAARQLEVVYAGDHDTLWAIAVRTRPHADPRVVVQRIIDLNSLDGGIIQPGQRLILPPK